MKLANENKSIIILLLLFSVPYLPIIFESSFPSYVSCFKENVLAFSSTASILSILAYLVIGRGHKKGKNIS